MSPLTITAIVLFFAGQLATSLGYRLGRRRLSKRPPTYYFTFACCVLAMVFAGAAIAFDSKSPVIPAFVIVGSAAFLALMLALPILHARSGYQPATINRLIKDHATQQQEVIETIATYLKTLDYEVSPATDLGHDLIALPDLDSASFINPNARQIRILADTAPAGNDLQVTVLVDVKEYVITVTWETETTKEVATQIETYLTRRYPSEAMKRWLE